MLNLLFLFFSIGVLQAQVAIDTLDQTKQFKEELLSITEKRAHFQIKTNLLYLAALMLNIEGEYYLGKNFSINLESQYAWWQVPSKYYTYRLWTFSPEVRYWIKPKKPLRGHFVALFGGIAEYDIMAGLPSGFKGDLMAYGLTYGFNFPLTKSLRMEVAISGGVVNATFEDYYFNEGCFVFDVARRKTYIGPTKLKVSLVWPFSFRVAKKRQKNARKRNIDVAANATVDFHRVRADSVVL